MTCRGYKPKKPETWTELVDSGMDEYEVAIALLAAAKEHMEDQEREIAELKAKLRNAFYDMQEVQSLDATDTKAEPIRR